MNRTQAQMILVLVLCVSFTLAAPLQVAAQDSPPKEESPQSQTSTASGSSSAWTWLKQGSLSFNTRWRFEGFERDGAPFTGTAYAPTLRLALGYETPVFYGFSAFAQGEAVIVTGPADYNDPTLPSQAHPNLPTILDPKSLQLSQGYLTWSHGADHKRATVRVGRQELTLNDGRFLNYSAWRQVHGSFDAAQIDLDLPRNFSFTYAFIN